jgi:AmmeMemoRadiSam system protein A
MSTKPPAPPKPCIEPKRREHLLSTARHAIRHGLRHEQRYEVDHGGLCECFLEPKATFVTLKLDGKLRGCIGNLEAYEALIDSIAHNADSAAFHDPRFAPVTAEEAPQLHIHISILGDSEPIHFKDEDGLLSQLRPGLDGLILKSNGHQATFLPSVWEQLPHPSQFLTHLKRKAGLSDDYWHQDIEIARYSVEQFGD